MADKPIRHGRDHRPGGEDPITGLTRISYGQVQDDGGILDAGSGDWTLSGGAGAAPFTITFNPAFSSPPAVVLTANNNNPAYNTGSVHSGDAGYFVEQHSISTTTLVVVVFSQDGTLGNDGGFNFVAVAAA